MIRKLLALLGVLAIVLAAGVAITYCRAISAARARVGSGSKVVHTPCGSIEYADVGSGPVIFAIHGAGGGFDQSLDLARAFLIPGYRIVAPSRFGYLRTPLPSDPSPIAQADAHACLLDALNQQKVVVLGGSMGAPSAMQLCLRHPDRCSALILLFPITFAPRRSSEPPPRPSATAQFLMDRTLKSDFAFWAALRLAPDSMIRTIGATPPDEFKKAAPPEQERVLAILDHILPIREREEGLKNDAAVARFIPRYELERFTVPTLVISAEDDLFGTFKGGRYTAEHIPGARFIGYPTGGHFLVGHASDVRLDLSRFLAATEGKAP
ncbi:MAG TPA: alpha/beta hydrolase [Terriglobales bacterium]|nr:alpha/beta hydrolase [Terriglobales bacterium]